MDGVDAPCAKMAKHVCALRCALQDNVGKRADANVAGGKECTLQGWLHLRNCEPCAEWLWHGTPPGSRRWADLAHDIQEQARIRLKRPVVRIRSSLWMLALLELERSEARLP